jgi:hypothetical protein
MISHLLLVTFCDCTDIPIGGKDVFIVLKRRYQFNWTAFGNFYFLETEGVVVAEDQPASAGAETCEASEG